MDLFSLSEKHAHRIPGSRGKKKKTRAGFILLLSVFVMLFLSLLFMYSFDLLTTDTMIIDNQRREGQALYLADAGIENALYQLRLDETWVSEARPGTPADWTTFGGGEYAVERALDSNMITSTARFTGGYSKSVQVTVLISGSATPFNIEVLNWQEI